LGSANGTAFVAAIEREKWQEFAALERSWGARDVIERAFTDDRDASAGLDRVRAERKSQMMRHWQRCEATKQGKGIRAVHKVRLPIREEQLGGCRLAKARPKEDVSHAIEVNDRKCAVHVPAQSGQAVTGRSRTERHGSE
jgi:hypothetical protein